MMLYDFRLGEAAVTVELDPSVTFDSIRPALGGISLAVADHTSMPAVKISNRDGVWCLEDSLADTSLQTKDFVALAHELSHSLIFHTASPLLSHYCIHAAAVAYRGQAIILPGLSGAGKSSLTCWLVSRGFEYVSDEFILIDMDRKVTGLARPIFIKSKGDSSIQSLITNSELIQSGEYVVAYEPGALGGSYYNSANAFDLGLVLIPEYSADTSHTITEASSARRGLALMGGNLNARNFDQLGLSGLMGVTDVPTWNLKYPNLVDMPECFCDQIKEVLER